jgi:membrane protein DedA with SNARE-associated domain
MDLKKFCIYTGAGGAIWMTTLTIVGYVIGGSKHKLRYYMPYITMACIAVVVLMVVVYMWHHRRKTKKNSIGGNNDVA